MLKFRHASLITIAGMIWLAVGVFLLNVGLRLIAQSAIELSEAAPLVGWFSTLFGGLQEAAVAIIGVALIVGFFKGRYVLAKTVRRMVDRIRSFPEPVAFHHIYGKSFYILIALMIGLGMLIRFLNPPADIRGMVDVVIGAALVNGSVHYFKHAMLAKKKAA